VHDVVAGIGPDLHLWTLDAGHQALTRRHSIRLPARIQYGWQHERLPVLYLACADRDLGAEGRYYLCPVSRRRGELTPLQAAIRLPHRPIHITLDPAGAHLVVTYSEPSGLTIHRVLADGRLDDGEPGCPDLDLGRYAHQARFSPGGDWLIVPSRGHAAGPGREPSPGRLNVLSWHGGRVALERVIHLAGRGGIGSFNPRHVDFHPTAPLLFTNLEPQNELVTLRFDDKRLDAEPLAVTPLLPPGPLAPRQLAAEVRVHPSGRHVYASTRADSVEGGGERGPGWITPEVLPVFGGGQNCVTVFEVDPAAGRLTPVQHAGTRGIYPRTFSIDPSGQLLLAGNAKPMAAREGQRLRDVPASLALFRVTAAGLEFDRAFPVDVGRETMEWTAIT
jgi:6-phosphogluconolactonase (cycloisomerase 2 family)